jgi:hypothetical protein
MVDAKTPVLTRLMLVSEEESALQTRGRRALRQVPWVPRQGQSDHRAQEETEDYHVSGYALGMGGQTP